METDENALVRVWVSVAKGLRLELEQRGEVIGRDCTTHPDDDETGEEFGDGNALDQTIYGELSNGDRTLSAVNSVELVGCSARRLARR